MRVMLDTNVIISLLLFPNKRINDMFEYILTKHTLVLSSFTVDKLYEVIRRKFPSKLTDVDLFLSQLSIDLVLTPKIMDYSIFVIRDRKDYPVLYTAYLDGTDILITGDKDFAEVNIEHPLIMTPSQFVDKYIYN